MSPDILHTNKFPSECVPTVFDSDAVTVMIAGEPCTLGLFDTAGENLMSVIMFWCVTMTLAGFLLFIFIFGHFFGN